MDQNALTVVAPIIPDQVDALNDLLTGIGTSLRNNPYFDISRLSTTHFLRWLILPPDEENPGPALLLFESNHDGEAETYLRDLAAQAGAALDAIYSKCEGFPVRGVADTDAYLGYMRKHSLPAAAFHIGYRGRTVGTVKAALAARQQLAGYLDDAQASHALDGMTTEQVGDRVRAEAARRGIQAIPARRDVPLFVYGAALFVFAGVLTKKRGWLPLLGVVGAAAAFLRWRETQDAADWERNGRPRSLPSASDNEKIRELAVREDILAQNQLTHVVRIKPGLFRRVTLQTVLWAINLLAKIVFNKGSLGGIPTIHFARWVILDEGRLVFFSNYDGSWDNYLGDFVDRASVGLTGVWSNTVDFPPTLFLLWRGAARIEFFKAWTRAHQVPTQLWYSAYPDNSVVNIRDAVQVLENLERETAPSWMQRL